MTAPVTARSGRHRLTPLARKVYALNLRTGRRELMDATSVCGQWRYERVEIEGTPWAVTFVPTGQEQWCGSLPAARRWTASPDALPLLRRQAQDVIDRGGANPSRVGPPEDPADCAARVAEARLHVQILDELLEVQHAA